MKLASWNVNSIKVRLPHVLDWLKETKVDVLCMQETKSTDDKFPKDEFQQIGYQSAYFGQKTYNGVAIVSKFPISEVVCNFPDIPKPEQARFIKAEIENIKIMNAYIPNGQAVGADKFNFKLDWLTKLKQYLKDGYSKEEKVLLCGDFNVAPEDRDVYDPEKTVGQILVSDQERNHLNEVKNWGFTDAYRMFVEEPGNFTWWDYRQLAFRRKIGFRIDHIWVSDGLKSSCKNASIDIAPRKKERPSDHTPIIVELAT